jgi:CHASE1-domain containing sensor protein
VPVDHFTVTWWMIVLAVAGALLLTLLILIMRLIHKSRTRPSSR